MCGALHSRHAARRPLTCAASVRRRCPRLPSHGIHGEHPKARACTQGGGVAAWSVPASWAAAEQAGTPACRQGGGAGRRGGGNAGPVFVLIGSATLCRLIRNGPAGEGGTQRARREGSAAVGWARCTSLGVRFRQGWVPSRVGSSGGARYRFCRSSANVRSARLPRIRTGWRRRATGSPPGGCNGTPWHRRGSSGSARRAATWLAQPSPAATAVGGAGRPRAAPSGPRTSGSTDGCRRGWRRR